MIDEETYKRELIRMWDILRGDEYKGKGSCDGVYCGDCPLSAQDDFVNDTCTNNINAFKVIKIVEKWAKENPPKKHKVSQLEYDILESVVKTIGSGFYFFEIDSLLMALLKKGYFEGATLGTDVKEYFKNCEVDCKLGGNENVKRRKV